MSTTKIKIVQFTSAKISQSTAKITVEHVNTLTKRQF